MKQLTFYLLCLLSATQVYAQNMQNVRQHINKLCSKEMYGRGYTFGGAEKASEYIKTQFEKAGLKPFNNEYFQRFNFPVNTFPKEAKVKLGNKSLVLGKDFIVSPNSGGGTAKGTLYVLSDSLFKKKELLEQEVLSLDLSNKILVFDAQHDRKAFMWSRGLYQKLQTASGIILLTDKLTFGVGRNQLKNPKVIVKRELVDVENIQKAQLKVTATFLSDYQARNVVGYIEGTEQNGKAVVFTAHYDHLGSIGKKVYFPGGNDNATGVTMLLELMDYYKKNPPKYRVVFMAFTAEEAGLVGSKYYVDHPFFPLQQIHFLINLDLFASGEEGMMAVNGTVFKEEYALLDSVNSVGNYLPSIQKRGKAANSDHYFFTEAGVPSFFFYLMGKSWQHYHDIYDTEKVPLTRFEGAYKLIRDFGNELMQKKEEN